MADALPTITHLINSPPGQLAAGGVLAGIVWKFFERVEAVLKDDTKLEIAVWLLGVKVSQKVEPWPTTFLTMFDRVFGSKHLSFRCFGRSAIASVAALVITYSVYVATSSNALFYYTYYWKQVGSGFIIMQVLLGLLVGNIVPDYFSLLVTRSALSLFKQQRSFWLTISASVMLVAVVTAIALTAMGTADHVSAINPLAALRWRLLGGPSELEFMHRKRLLDFWRMTHDPKAIRWLWFYPAYFTTVWFLLYSGSGFLLIAARRFDIGFEWFNRKFDIEKKPLQSIGLVAGALVAIGYWAAVIVTRLLA